MHVTLNVDFPGRQTARDDAEAHTAQGAYILRRGKGESGRKNLTARTSACFAIPDVEVPEVGRQKRHHKRHREHIHEHQDLHDVLDLQTTRPAGLPGLPAW